MNIADRGRGAGERAGRAGEPPPELIVLGAMKCGTSSLHYYLDLHPQITMTRRKELNFFLDPEPVAAGTSATEIALMKVTSTASRGLDWYRSRFEGNAPIRGESSVAYSFPWYPAVAERIARASPGVLLIFAMRHPLARALSHHRQLAAHDRRTPREALLAPGNPYVAASAYATMLKPFLEQFPRQQVLLLRHEDLLLRRRAAVAEVFSFLGVDDTFYSPLIEHERNRSMAKGRLYSGLEQLRSGAAGPLIERVPRRARGWAERLLSRHEGQITSGGALGDDATARVLEQLTPEIDQIEQLTGWSLADWRRPPTPV